MNIPFVDLKTQYKSLAPHINQAINQVLQNTNFILGQAVTLFEEQFAAYCQSTHCIAVDNGTSALELTLRAYNIGSGDEVITVANTFIATIGAIVATGAKPILVDCYPDTYNINIQAVAQAITAHTKAIIPVHLYGQPTDMDPLLQLAHTHNLLVIEDACQAHGATYKGRLVGSLGHAACFSFYPAKNLGAYGDGGAIVTNDTTLAQTARTLRNYGQTQKYHHHLPAFNRRLDTLQAAILSVKLPHLNHWNQRRIENAQLYSRLLTSSLITIPVIPTYLSHVYHLYVIRTPQREALQTYLSNHDIATGIHYPIPVHCQKAYRYLGYNSGDFPITEDYATQILSLPMYPELTETQITYVAETIKSFYEKI